MVEVLQISIQVLNVISREQNTFTCEIEFDASLLIDLSFDVGARYGIGDDEYEAPREISVGYTHLDSFDAVVVVKYEVADPIASELLSVDCRPGVEIDLAEIDEVRTFRY